MTVECNPCLSSQIVLQKRRYEEEEVGDAEKPATSHDTTVDDDSQVDNMALDTTTTSFDSNAGACREAYHHGKSDDSMSQMSFSHHAQGMPQVRDL